jgi:twitching motility two-component system response regulator PilG
MTHSSPYAPHTNAMPRRLVTIIDDSPTIRKIVEVTCAREGYQVLAFGDGMTALRYLLAMAGGNGHGPAQGPNHSAQPPLTPTVALTWVGPDRATVGAGLVPAHADIPLPCVIFIDLQLPGMDGLQVVKLLRQRPAFARTKLVILSRRAGLVDRLFARLAGADAYLVKPVRTEVLLAQIAMGERV